MLLTPAIVTREPKPRKGLPPGSPGEVRSGFEFYLNFNGKKADFITLEISEQPILHAVTDQQEHLWQGAFAVPVKRIWINGIWAELPKKLSSEGPRGVEEDTQAGVLEARTHGYCEAVRTTPTPGSNSLPENGPRPLEG